MGDKTHQATPFKLQKAKEKGQSAKSPELSNALFLLAVTLLIFLSGARIVSAVRRSFIDIIYEANNPLINDKISLLFRSLFSNMFMLWLPFALACVFILIIINSLQQQFIIAPSRLKPSFSVFNPKQGIKKAFGFFSYIRGVMALLKLLMLFFIIYIHRSALLSPNLSVTSFLHLFFKISLFSLGALLIIGVIDSYIHRFRFHKENRMSTQEIKEEYRSQEGDPVIKMKRQQLRMTTHHKRSLLTEVKKATVIITHTAHIAVALQYEQQRMAAPKIIYKGQGLIAERITALGKKYHIPIINNAIAASLFQTIDINQWITPAFFKPVAYILHQAYATKEERMGNNT